MAFTGGISEVSGFENNLEYVDLAKFAIEDYNKKQVKQLRFFFGLNFFFLVLIFCRFIVLGLLDFNVILCIASEYYWCLFSECSFGISKVSECERTGGCWDPVLSYI